MSEKAAACKSVRETMRELDHAGALISDFLNHEKYISGVYSVVCRPVVFCMAAFVDQMKVKSVSRV